MGIFFPLLVRKLSSEALKQFAKRSCGCPTPLSLQGQVGWGCEQPGIPAPDREGGN